MRKRLSAASLTILRPIRRQLVGWLVCLIALGGGGPNVAAAAAKGLPLSIHIECQAPGRTKVCPDFLRGLLDKHPHLRWSPRAGADLVLYVNAVEVESHDELQLRFVSSLRQTPSTLEVYAQVDIRATDDAQIGAVSAPFDRAIAIYVGAVRTEAVEVAFQEVETDAKAAPATSPWSQALTLSGWGNYTKDYKSGGGFGELDVTRVSERSRFRANVGGSLNVSYQPPLIVEGTEVSLDTSSYSMWSNLGLVWDLAPKWAVATLLSAYRDDPNGQFRYSYNFRTGIEWNRYMSNDPRGNKFAVRYMVGWQVDGYTVRNEIGERFAQFPVHEFAIESSVRHDQQTFGLELSGEAELLHPTRRYSFSISPETTLHLGKHIDLSLGFGATVREFPEPDPAAIDPSNYEQQSRLSYAQRFSAWGNVSLRLYWDATNGARYDRF